MISTQHKRPTRASNVNNQREHPTQVLNISVQREHSTQAVFHTDNTQHLFRTIPSVQDLTTNWDKKEKREANDY